MTHVIRVSTLVVGTIAIAVSGSACTGQPDSSPSIGHGAVGSPVVLLDREDVAAYRAGVSREIGLRSEAERLGFVAREELVDSAAAAAAGLPVSRYRVVAGAVEALLAQGLTAGIGPEQHLSPGTDSIWTLQRLSLDSLRLEAVVLRARTGS